jgi:cob(I)alamin adenosyltransferase
MEKNWKIYTKTGDKGETSLIGGTRVPKFHLRIEAYGTLDELNSYIGYLRDQVNDAVTIEFLLGIQQDVFIAESVLATDRDVNLDKKLPQLDEIQVIKLENEIDRLNTNLPSLTNFIIPGGHPLVSLCHVCRTVCRRAERIIIHLASELEVDTVLIKYINRLSDYLFVLARWLAKENGVQETPWKTE